MKAAKRQPFTDEGIASISDTIITGNANAPITKTYTSILHSRVFFSFGKSISHLTSIILNCKAFRCDYIICTSENQLFYYLSAICLAYMEKHNS